MTNHADERRERFEREVRNLLRRYPDTVVIGEIADEASAALAAEAARTGTTSAYPAGR